MKRLFACLGIAFAMIGLLLLAGCRKADEGKARYNPSVPVAYNEPAGMPAGPNTQKRIVLPQTP